MTSKRYFTLIHGDRIHAAPKSKVVSAEDFSTLVDAIEVLDKVREDAENYKKEVVAEVEALKEQAQREGFEAGFKSWSEQIAKLEAEIVKVRQDTEKVIIPVALKAAKKIVGREIELSDTAILDIIANNLKAVSQHKKITIYVNKKDLDIVEANKTRLKQIFETLEVLAIRDRADIKPGGCVIETEGGIINAQLDNQWRILETAFEVLMKQKPSEGKTT